MIASLHSFSLPAVKVALVSSMDQSGNGSAKGIALQLQALYFGSKCLFVGKFLRLLFQFIIEVRSSFEVVEAVEGDVKEGDDVKEEVFLRTVKETTLFK